MAKIDQVGQVELGLPAGKVLNKGEHVDHVVHADVGDLPGVQGVQAELVHLEAGHNAERPQERLRDVELPQRVGLGQVP